VRVSVDSADSDRVRLRFEVADTGIGISPEAQARLFQPFTQADASTTRRYGGTGLGLVICQRLTALMGGEIGVRSAAGAGSTFWFTVPLEHARSPHEPVPPDGALATLRILAVDDSWTALRQLEQQLVEWNIGVATVDDAGRAMVLLEAAAAAGTPYDVALIDYQMPGVDGLELGRRIKASPGVAATKLVLLTAVGARGQARAAEEAGFAAFLTKPLRQSALHDCLAMLAGAGGATESPTQRAPLITRHTVAEARGTSRARILVAEDNPVNQRVAVGLLERLGFGADVVSNGREALEAVTQRPYDLVLMDCQMPVMDGYEASARIRQSESGGRRVPIIAMTADAMTADRERCLAAGMDEHLPKPVDRNQLRLVLSRWLPEPAAPDPLVGDAPQPEAEVLFDPGQLHSIVGDDQAAARRYLDLYATTAAELLGRAGAVLDGRDASGLRELAHNLKGSSGNVGAVTMARLAAELEEAASAGEWNAAAQCYREIQSAFDRTVTHVRLDR
jgi:CheY-like chemotaxis protein